ncbi:MAG: hypothetical protein M3N98_03170, partial [Actinomycetota bacterium]|nr:hypothetical protein [Actinomycetota bacterium]
MDSRDDAGFDGDETLDWLWDLDDRYDVGPVDGGPTSEVAAVSAGSGVKKHLRKPRVRAEPVAVPAMVAAGAATEAASVTGRPKESEESDQGEATGAVPIPIGLPARSGRSVRDRLVHDGRLTRGGVAAALLLVLGLGGIAFALSQSGGGKSHLSSNVAISPTTDTSVTDTTTTAPGTPSQPPTSDTT